MKAADIPTRFPIPFANAAGGSYIRNIPTVSQIDIVDGAASLTDGFPPLNFLPIASGGVPPFGEDFNGLLKQITQWVRWSNNAGVPATYNSSFSSSIGGYPKGAMLAHAADPTQFWISTVDDNTTDPDSGGADWFNFPLGFVTAQAQSFIVIVDQKPNGTAGGLFQNGAWRTRDLNTVVSDPSNFVGSGVVSVGSNQVTLYAGTWAIEASAPAVTVDSHKLRWQNITDSTTAIYGSVENTTGNVAITGDQVQTRSQLVGSFVITATKVFELQHVCETTSTGAGGGSYGFGVPSSYGLGAAGGPETYSIVKLNKVG